MNSNEKQMKPISVSLPVMGAIFMSNSATKEECFRKKLLGLPLPYTDFVKQVRVGMLLFLFEYEKRLLYGVFEATTNGTINLVPHAYTSSGKHFPAQVQFSTIWQCHPLPEQEFRSAIHENYYARNKFKFGLSERQVYNLLQLFELQRIDVPRSPTSVRGEIVKKSGSNYHNCRSLACLDGSSKGYSTSHNNADLQNSLNGDGNDHAESEDSYLPIKDEGGSTNDHPHVNFARNSSEFPLSGVLPNVEPNCLKVEPPETTILGDYISLSPADERRSPMAGIFENSLGYIPLSPSEGRGDEVDYTEKYGEPRGDEDFLLPQSAPVRDGALSDKQSYSKGFRSDESNQRISVFSRLKVPGTTTGKSKSPVGGTNRMTGLSLHNVMRRMQTHSRRWMGIERIVMQKFVYPEEENSTLDSDSASSEKKSASEGSDDKNDLPPDAAPDDTWPTIHGNFESNVTEAPILNFKSKSSRKKAHREAKMDDDSSVAEPPKRRKLVRSMFSAMSSDILHSKKTVEDPSPSPSKTKHEGVRDELEQRLGTQHGTVIMSSNDEEQEWKDEHCAEIMASNGVIPGFVIGCGNVLSNGLSDASSVPSELKIEASGNGSHKEESPFFATKQERFVNQSIGIQVDLADD